MERRGELPSEQALRKARDHRDHGWSLVLALLQGKGVQEEFVPGRPLEEAFPQAIAQADDIADQLREQAEAVAQAEEKRFQITQSEKQNQEAEETISALQNNLKECQIAWEALWTACGIVPRSPNEMEEWRETWSDVQRVSSSVESCRGILSTEKQSGSNQPKSNSPLFLPNPRKRSLNCFSKKPDSGSSKEKSQRAGESKSPSNCRRSKVSWKLSIRTARGSAKRAIRHRTYGSHGVRRSGCRKIFLPIPGWRYCGNERKFLPNSIPGKN